MPTLAPQDSCRCLDTHSAMPSFAADKSGIELFPFDHTVAVLDLEDSAVREIVQVIETVHRLLTRGNVMATRNDIAHPAEDFPTIEQINTSLLASEEAVTLLEATCATPFVWHRGERVSDE